MTIAGHVSRAVPEHYSHLRQEAKRKAVASLDSDTITSQLPKWKADAVERRRLELEQKKRKLMVGMGRLELPHTLGRGLATLAGQTRCAFASRLRTMNWGARGR